MEPLSKEEVEQRVGIAMQLLVSNDEYLFENDVSERAITHRLGMYLQCEFPNYHVDCEYNRNLGDSKRIVLSDRFTQKLDERLLIIRNQLGKSLEELQNEIRKGDVNHLLAKMAKIDELKDAIASTFPDIIIHRRGKNNVSREQHFNLIIIEAKKEFSAGDRDFDIEKLKAFRDLNQTYKYRYAIFVIFHNDRRGNDPNKISSPRVTWQYLDDQGNIGEKFTA